MKYVKVLLALILIVAAGYTAVNSVLPRSYSGSDLSFKPGSGTVTITNPSAESVPARLVTVSRSFGVSSRVEGLSGSPLREGSGTSATYTLEFSLPPGVSEFTITRGQDVTFVADTETKLEATVQPMSSNSSRTIIILAVGIVLVALFYISKTTDHRWLGMLRRQKTPVAALKPMAQSVAGGQGRPTRSYGDNRESVGD